MKILRLVIAAIPCGVTFLTTETLAKPDKEYELVLIGGRVMDPESGLDAIRDVAIEDGKIAAISERKLAGREFVDVSGLVVAPGFIDFHAHGQDPFSARLQALDGVTTALELELGAYPIAPWYEAREGKSVINFGASVGHPSVRTSVMRQSVPGADGDPDGEEASKSHQLTRWSDAAMSESEIVALEEGLEQGLADGALGIGFGLAYTPGAGRVEIWRAFRVAARHGVITHVHLRHSGAIEPGSAIGAVQEVLADAASTGAALHIAHIATTARRDLPEALEMLDAAKENRIDVSTEVYPWAAASTRIGAAIFDAGWRERTGASFADLEWAATGERLTEASFNRYRTEQPHGSVIAHIIPAEMVEYGIAHPGVIIVSDGPTYVNGRGHPRGAGSFARALGRYVREKKTISLMTALAKMTLLPAQRLERSTPQMAHKGRIKIGADADITVFDPERILENATYHEPILPSAGIAYVLVGGEFVVRKSAIVEGAYPGKPIRRQLH